MSRERSDHTLQTTVLVHEAYLRLINRQGAGWRSRTDFFAVAVKVMRHLLVDYAKTRTRARRGGGDVKLSLGECLVEQKRYQDAAPLLVRSYEDLKSTQGGANPRTVEALNRLIKLYEASGNRDDAARYNAILASPSP